MNSDLEQSPASDDYLPEQPAAPENFFPEQLAASDDLPSLTGRAVNAVAVVLAVLAGVAAYRWLQPSTTFAADGHNSRWDAAVERSHETHTPSLVLFTADWCGACQAMHERVLSREDVSCEINSHYTMITIDLTDPSPDAQARAKKFGVSAIPTLIRFDAEGKETSRTHSLPPEKMLAWLQAGE